MKAFDLSEWMSPPQNASARGFQSLAPPWLATRCPEVFFTSRTETQRARWVRVLS